MYSAANDPQTGRDPRFGPQMIPAGKETNGVDFGFLDFFFIYFFHQLKDKLDQIKEN